MGYRFLVLITLVLTFFLVGCSNSSAPSGGGNGGGPATRGILKGDVVRAVMKNDKERLRQLIASGADINENVGDSENAITPMMAAIVNRRTDIALELLDNGASLSPTYYGYSAYAFSLRTLGDTDPISSALKRRQP